MQEWTAIVLAGQRPGETAFPRSLGVTAKALIPVAGEPMVARVARTLLACRSVAHVVILAQDAQELLAGAPAWLRNEPRVAAANGSDGISASIAAVGGTSAAPWPVLVTTADHPLLTVDMVEALVAAAAGADAAFAVVDRPTIEKAYPQTRRTWLKFSDGHYSGANLFALLGPNAAPALQFWARVERDRKKVRKMLTFFGPVILLRALTRTLSLDALAVRVGRKLNMRLRPVRLPFAEAAIDVDKRSDLELVEQILAGRARNSVTSC